MVFETRLKCDIILFLLLIFAKAYFTAQNHFIIKTFCEFNLFARTGLRFSARQKLIKVFPFIRTHSFFNISKIKKNNYAESIRSYTALKKRNF